MALTEKPITSSFRLRLRSVVATRSTRADPSKKWRTDVAGEEVGQRVRIIGTHRHSGSEGTLVKRDVGGPLAPDYRACDGVRLRRRGPTDDPLNDGRRMTVAEPCATCGRTEYPHECFRLTIKNSLYYCPDGERHEAVKRRWRRKAQCVRCGEKVAI